MENPCPAKEYFFTVPQDHWDKLNQGKIDHQLYAKGYLLKEVNQQDKVHFSTSINSKIWLKPTSFFNKNPFPILIFHNGEKWLKEKL